MVEESVEEEVEFIVQTESADDHESFMACNKYKIITFTSLTYQPTLGEQIAESIYFKIANSKKQREFDMINGNI